MSELSEQTVGPSASRRLSGVLEASPACLPAQASTGPGTFIRLAVLGALFLGLHWSILEWLGLTWWENPNWSHGGILPLFSLYLVYCRWGELRGEVDRPSAPRQSQGLPSRAVWSVLILLAPALVWVAARFVLASMAWPLARAGWICTAPLLAAMWLQDLPPVNRLLDWLLFRRPCWGGLILMGVFLLTEVSALAVYPGLWVLGLSMIGMLFGLVMFLNGVRAMRLLWLPVLFLALAVPVPETLYNRVAYPLQEVAAAGSVHLLQLFEVDIQRKASQLELISQAGHLRQLTVAEACSGMRLLMAFFALGVATAYLETRPVWQRVVLVLSALPIAVLCNVLRVAITCTMYYIDRPELGKGFLHGFTGMLMLIPAFVLLWLLGRLLMGVSWVGRRLIVEVDEPDGTDRPVPPPAVREGRP